jgi:hypothetical protein
MSRSSVTVHVGPYAEILLLREYVDRIEKMDGLLETWHMNHNFAWVTIDGQEFGRDCFAPYFSEYNPIQPPRKMHWDDETSDREARRVVPVTGEMIEAEIEWFKQTYAAFLQVMADGCGQPLHVRWGIVTSIG